MLYNVTIKKVNVTIKKVNVTIIKVNVKIKKVKTDWTLNPLKLDFKFVKTC